VLFDLDGTLWGDAPGWKGDAADYARLSEIEARRLAPHFQRFGIRLDPLEVVSNFWDYARRREIEEAASLRAPSGPGLLQEFLILKGAELTPLQAVAAWSALDIPASEYGRTLFADARPTLAHLAESGLSMAVVSNRISGDGALRADLGLLGIAGYFGAIVCSSHVGWRKPHAAVFEAALSALGVPAGDAVMVGDSFENDVRGAKAVGMHAVLKTNGREISAEERHEADHVIENLSELIKGGILEGG
jgi:FMN phosphatase YigB (HAD superfamily)